MADLSIQFHALPEELAPFIVSCAREMNLKMAALFFPPFSVEGMDDQSTSTLLANARCDGIAFSDKSIVLPAKNQLEFADKNPALLYLQIGRQCSNGLRSSRLACRTLSLPMNPKWKKMASKLKKITKAGAKVINPKTGTSGYIKNHRYMPGAKAFSDGGGTVAAPGGGNILKLGLAQEEGAPATTT